MEHSDAKPKHLPTEEVSARKASFFALPAEIRHNILLFNSPLSISLQDRTTLTSASSSGASGEINPPVYELNASLVLVKDPGARGDFEQQIRAASLSVALRDDMQTVIEHRERQLTNLDSKVQSILEHDKLCNEWTGAVYRLWLRDERVLHEYAYYCFRLGLPLVKDLKKAGYELIKLKRAAAKESASSRKASFKIPFTPDGKAARFEVNVIKARKRKLSGDSSELNFSERRDTISPNSLRYFPINSVHNNALARRNGRFPRGPIDEVENEQLYFQAVMDQVNQESHEYVMLSM